MAHRTGGGSDATTGGDGEALANNSSRHDDKPWAAPGEEL
jgi:hypothetical protein